MRTFKWYWEFGPKQRKRAKWEKNRCNSSNEKISEGDKGKGEGGKMWRESVVNENMENDLAGFMSQNWDKCERIP